MLVMLVGTTDNLTCEIDQLHFQEIFALLVDLHCLKVEWKSTSMGNGWQFVATHGTLWMQLLLVGSWDLQKL